MGSFRRLVSSIRRLYESDSSPTTSVRRRLSFSHFVMAFHRFVMSFRLFVMSFRLFVISFRRFKAK